MRAMKCCSCLNERRPKTLPAITRSLHGLCCNPIHAPHPSEQALLFWKGLLLQSGSSSCQSVYSEVARADQYRWDPTSVSWDGIASLNAVMPA